MKRTLLGVLALISAATAGAVGSRTGVMGAAAQGAPGPSAQVQQAQAVVTAANAFLDSLGPDQRGKAQFAFTPQKTATIARFARSGGPGGGGGPPGDPGDPPPSDRRGPGGPGGPRGPGGGPGMGPVGGFVGEQYGEAVWSNYPVSDVPRPGLQMGALSSPQREAAMRLLQAVLSPQGYRKVLEIMGSDQALSDAGQPFASGASVYTIGVFGTPSVNKPWMLQFGGHHLALNIVMSGPDGSLTPTLTGAQPAIYIADGKTVRVLAEENDKAFALLDALDDGQRRKAILPYQVGDLVMGPGHAGESIVPEGLKGSAMNARQRAMLVDLVAQWAGIINGAYAKPRMEEIAAGLDNTYFAWSGPTAHQAGRNGSSYYRIQGPKLLIEFSPQGVGGDSTMHVHTIYRDPTNDYGRAFTMP